jgi:hypothetical protein
MTSDKVRLVSLICLMFACFGIALSARAAEEADEQAQLLKSLPTAKHSLVAGIQQATAKAPEAAVSAKFEFEDGALSLSIYTVEKGLSVSAEDNVLKEIAGSPDAAEWKPEVEVFKDVEHVSRASEQLTLMALTKLSLIDVVKKAETDQPGTVFSVTPVLSNRMPQFVVLVADQGKVHELHYDLMSGNRLTPAK